MRQRKEKSLAVTAIASTILALALPPGAAFAGKAPVQSCWSGLGPLVEGRPVKLTLASGVRVRGRAIAVGREALEIAVKKTSDRAVVSKGRREIPRTQIESISVRRKRSVLGRAILTPLLGLAGAAGAAGLLTMEFLAGSGKALQWGFFFGVAAGTAALGYRLGSRLDHKWVEIVLLPQMEPSCGGQPPPGPHGASGPGRGRNQRW